MKKIKISEVVFSNGVAMYDGENIDLSIPFYKLFDLEDEELKFIIFKDQYLSIPTMQFMNKMIYTQCLASLLNLEIKEDKTIIDEVKDSFFVTMTDNIKMAFGFNSIKVNPYKMSYEEDQKLKKEEDGSYTLNSIMCIENSGRTTHYFRDFLILYNSQNGKENTLVLSPGEGLKKQFPTHQFINPRFNQSLKKINERIEELSNDHTSYDSMYNLFLYELLSKHDKGYQKVAKVMFNATDDMINYNNIYLDVVELQAIKLKSPELLFSELMQSDDEKDIVHGLLKLGFKIVE